MEEAEMGFVGETLNGSVQCGGKIVEDACGDSVKGVGTEASLFAEFLETIDSILYMPPIGNDNIDGNSNIVDDIEEMSNFRNYNKFDANSNIFADIMETINMLNMPIGNDKVDGNSNIVHELVCGTEVAKEQIIADKDVSGVSALDAEQADAHEGMQIDVEDQQGTETSKTTNQTTEVKGLSVSIGSEENFDANKIVEKGTQITDQGSHVLLRDGKEKLNEQSNIRQNIEEQECVSEQVGLGSNGGQGIEEEFIEGQRKPTDGKAVKHALVKPGSSEIVHQARFSLPTIKKEGQFSVSDMVWSKVRCHPWWPGQIFDPPDASEWPRKHYKKDCYFVAYFGDKTFAWNEASELKHFRAHFSTMEKQRSFSESFQNAIDCALDEVSRRVEYGLACSCIPKDNTGIRQEIGITHGVDESQNAYSFSPMKLIEYVKTLSELPTGGFDRLELGIAKAQLFAFNRFKSFSCLPEIQRGEGADKDNPIFVDDEQDLCEVIEHATPVVNKDDQAGPRNLKNQSSTHQKRKYNFKDTMHPTKKEKRMSDPMNGTPDSPDGDCWTPDNLVSSEHSKKRSAFDHFDDDLEMQAGKITISGAKVSNTTNSPFKIGGCIHRAASQLTVSPILKCSSDRSLKTDGDVDVFPENGLENTAEYSSLDYLLSSLQCVAQKPLGEYTFLNGIISFFSDFKNSVIVAADSEEVLGTDKVGSKRKKLAIAGTGPETFEYMSDTYWTNLVIDNGNEEKPVQQPLPKNQNAPAELFMNFAEFNSVPSETNLNRMLRRFGPLKESETEVDRVSSRARVVFKKGVDAVVALSSAKKFNIFGSVLVKNSESNHAETPEKPPGYIDENAPAELVMNFSDFNSVPSETNLNKMFRRFGQLKESETEVDRVSSRARVVFKKCVDAEVALSSAKKFNIFGSALVNYQLNYTPSALFKAFRKKT